MPITPRWRIAAMCAFMFLLTMLGGCAGCAGNAANPDPWEKTNRFFYQVDDGLDRVALKPLSDFYIFVVPKPVRTGLGNGFDNLGYFNVILNDFLQGQWQQGCSDSGRMAVNSTVGLAGFFDVGSRLGLPSHDNDFGITLGKWGAPPGPYLVLPLFGPSTVRDAPGIGVGILTDPTTWLNLPLKIVVPLYTVEAVDARARARKEVQFRNAAAIDPYAFTRNAYMQYREGQIHGAPPKVNQSIYDEDVGPATQPSTRSAPPLAPAAPPPPPATQSAK